MLIKSSWQASLLLNTNNNYNKTFYSIVTHETQCEHKSNTL